MQNKGFTLIELAVTLAVASILVTLAVPGFHSFIQDTRATSESSLLLSALNFARNSAVTQGVPVSVCSANSQETNCSSNSSDWNQGWIVFTDDSANPGYIDSNSTEKILKVFPPPGKTSTIKTKVAFLQYLPQGQLNASLVPSTALNSSSLVSIALTVSPCSGDKGRDISIALSGDASVSKSACQ